MSTAIAAALSSFNLISGVSFDATANNMRVFNELPFHDGVRQADN